ncbi:prephenate dehydratase [Propioniciclava coleopterorum]|uniref:Prephenate dehydratase n=1 Tax=Propioniciclava coleopterorum TaxID=2714937 RepID=A0A6G7YB84_9ACTN|nr:prephenate dehydratase [Propioniciclava coleopterorum]
MLRPEGTFTHQALRTVTDADARPFASVQAVLNAVRSGEIEAGLVPIENSVEGGVTATLDNLASGEPLVITSEVLLPVAFVLAVRPGTAISDVRRVITHPHAHAQTRDWVIANLPQAVVTEGGSTAGAAEEVAREDSRFDAAICARVAADLYGLDCLATDIADNPDAVTRFVMVRRPGALPEPTGADKTTLVAYMFADHSGALLDILQQFAMRGVNLTRIESRPTKKAFGDYCFSIDAEGHIGEPRLRGTLKGLHRVCRTVTFLGSYPRADKVEPKIARGFTDADYAAAERWIDDLMGREPRA